MSAKATNQLQTANDHPVDSKECGKQSWWGRRTKLEKKLSLTSLICLVLLCVLFIVLCVLAFHKNEETELCITFECIKSAFEVLSNLDETMDPCFDFYKFACGGWLEAHDIPDDEFSITPSTAIEDSLDLKIKGLLEKKFTGLEPDYVLILKGIYHACLDEVNLDKEGDQPLKLALRQFGGWPVVEGDAWNDLNFNWTNSLINMRRLGFDYNVLVKVKVALDHKNATTRILTLDQPFFGMVDRSHLIHGLYDAPTGKYLDWMVKVATKLGADATYARDELRQAVDFEIELAKISAPEEDRRDMEKMYNKMTIKQLKQTAPQVDWLRYLQGMCVDQISENEQILVLVPNYMRKFARLIDGYDKRAVANYMMWRVVDYTLPLLGKEWRDLDQEYAAAVYGNRKEKPRWEVCVNSLDESLLPALAALYVQDHVEESGGQDTILQVIEITQYVLEEFIKSIDGLKWMDTVTKQKAKDKANAMEAHIGYPQELLNSSYVSNLYKTLSLDNLNYLVDKLKISKWQTDEFFSLLRKPYAEKEWKNQAISVIENSFYGTSGNSIVFPLGMLQKPFFDKDRPEYLNFGAIGHVIAHEMTHSFDEKGRRFNKDGNFENWWSRKTEKLFKDEAKCIVDQYNEYIVPDVLMPVKGDNTKSENIADNVGLKQAYLAYLSWVKDNGEEPQLPGLDYSPNQLFWISAAQGECGKHKPEYLKELINSDSHSPPHIRVVGALSNLQEFAKDFKCPAGSPMNPDEKCSMW